MTLKESIYGVPTNIEYKIHLNDASVSKRVYTFTDIHNAVSQFGDRKVLMLSYADISVAPRMEIMLG